MRVGNLNRYHRRQTLAKVLARRRRTALEHIGVTGISVHRPRQGRAKTGKMRAPVDIANIIGKSQHIFGITVVILNGNIARHTGLFFLLRKADHIRKRRLALVKILHKGLEPVAIMKDIFLLKLVVLKNNVHAGVKIRQFANPLN